MIARILSLQLLIVLSALVPTFLLPAAAQEDALTVRTNDDEYNLEETVRVTGKVGDLVGSENVIVKWIKPDRNSITLSATPKPDGTYSANLLLDSDEVTGGKWMVQVAYSDWVANSTFVVKDPFFDVEVVGGNSDGVFENGQQVTIAGTIFNKESSEERVTMTIRNGKGNVFESVLALLDKREFSHTFSLEGSKVLYGEWTVDLRYFGGHRTALTFDVVPSPVTIKTDKSSFFPGDAALIMGALDESIASGSGKVVSITITNQNGEVYKTGQVETSSNGSYVFQLEFSGAQAASYGEWKAVAEYANHKGIAAFSMKEPAVPLTVKTNMPSFTPSQPIRVLGKIAELSSHSVAVHLFSDSGILLKYAETNVNQNYTFAHEITPDHDADPGIYEILVTYDGHEARTTFEVKNSVVIIDDDDGVPVITGTYKLEIDEHIHNIKYKLMGTEAIERMTLNNQTKTLTMEVFSSQNGTLTIEIPRRVIDSVGLNGDDTQYVVSATYANGSMANLAYNEANSTEMLRILTMNFEKDTDLITITGTKVIPEFGALSVTVLVTAVVLTMIIGYLGRVKYRARIEI